MVTYSELQSEANTCAAKISGRSAIELDWRAVERKSQSLRTKVETWWRPYPSPGG